MRFLSQLLLAISLLTLTAVSHAEATSVVSGDAKKTDKEIPEAMNFVSNGSVKIDGRTIEYTATAGTVLMKDENDEPIALFGYTAYIKESGDRNKRPIVFA